ncbi:MAG: NAD-dependent epimerase/dehydratase family protein [Salinivirgaceae bacterium]|jgi:nucleoside-diphosphate-sugar epimerase|nr:NAD-dependent epimerase/dehydratase family protein [Salinivirgaceae bacterium]
MKALFIGGTGIISSACTDLALEKDVDLYHLNRGKSFKNNSLSDEKMLMADINNKNEVKKVLGEHNFDVVVDWITFLPEQLKYKMNLFKGRAKQFVFISSASAYQTPPLKLPVTEETPLNNPIWQYSRDKAACEELLKKKASNYGFTYTIIRPSHTYDKTLIPMPGGYTTLHRIKNDLPVIVPGDGTSLWTMTHHKDFAKGLVGILDNDLAFNETFHITSEELITWNRIYELMGNALGKKVKMVHVPSTIIAKYNKDMGDSLLGDKCHSMIFDNDKIRRAVGGFECKILFEQGAKEIAEWFLTNQKFEVIDEEINRIFEELIEKYS